MLKKTKILVQHQLKNADFLFLMWFVHLNRKDEMRRPEELCCNSSLMQKHIKPWWHEDIKRNYPQILDKRHENKTWNPVSTIGGLPFFFLGCQISKPVTCLLIRTLGKSTGSLAFDYFSTSVCVFKCLYICVCVFLQVPQQWERSVERLTQITVALIRDRNAALTGQLLHAWNWSMKMRYSRQPGCGLWTQKHGI